MSMNKTVQPTYKDGRTKQSFKDETDINKILQRAQKTGTISHLNQHQAEYGDYAGYDFFANQLMLTKGREIFDDLPSEIRSEFNQSPAGFFKYVNDPNNKDRLNKLLPGLAAPGRQNLEINQNAGADASSEPQANDQPIPATPASPADNTPPTAPNASVEPPPAS